MVETGTVMKFIGGILQGLIRAYQLLIIPVLPAGGCRFHPSCSTYAMDAIRWHGPIKGAWLAMKRIGRCHPWGEAGLDPVPSPVPPPAPHLKAETEKAAG